MVAIRPRGLAILALGVLSAHSSKEGAGVRGSANPVRKVVHLLQNMKHKVEEEGETQEKLYEKFACYCKNNAGVLGASMESAQSKIPQLTAELESASQRRVQLEDEVYQHKVDVAAAMDAQKKATAVRQREAKAHKKYLEEQSIEMDAVEKAVGALGMGGSFLQSNMAQVVLQAANSNEDIDEEDRQQLLAFLANSGSTESPTSGIIIGILKQMAATLKKTIGDAVRKENSAAKVYDELMAAKTKELEALKQAIRSKNKRKSEFAVLSAQLKEDLEDTQKGLNQDMKLAAQMQTSCGTKGKEYKQESITRQKELQAISETIAILTSDESRTLLKKTLPSSSSSFLQLQTTMTKVRTQAMSLLRQARSHQFGDRSRLDLIVLALHGKSVGFEAVIPKIDTLVQELEEEQAADVKKKVYCQTRLDEAEDKSKSLDRSIASTKDAISSEKESLAATEDDLARLDKHIKELDKDVAEATEQRKEEHSAFLKQMADNTAAKELLEFAKQRLQSFYGAALAQAGELAQADDSALPEVPSYKKKTSESNGILSILNALIADIEKDMAALKVEEQDAQKDYETTVRDAKDSRTTDSETFMAKEDARVNVKTKLEDDKGENKNLVKELMANEEHTSSLHRACDWLLRNFGTRRAARSSEIENLKNAKLVLSGTEASLLQTHERRFLRRVD